MPPCKQSSEDFLICFKNFELPKGLLISIKNKQKLGCNFFLSGNAFEKHFYKMYANKLTQVKNLSKKMYYTKSISKNKSNSKKM